MIVGDMKPVARLALAGDAGTDDLGETVDVESDEVERPLERGPIPSVHGSAPVGLPLVPDEAWIRATSRRGTARRPNGYCSRRSVLRTNGRRARSESAPIVVAPSRSR